MRTVVFSSIKDTYKPDDLVPITIERIKNKNTSSYVPKFMVHVNGDTFGLFSDRYTYCSTKSLISHFDKYELQHYVYHNGFLTAYLKSKDESNALPIDQELLQVFQLVTLQNLSMFNSTSSSGIFICNSYNGASKIQMGSYISIKFNDNITSYTKLDLIDEKALHVTSLDNKLEQTLDTLRKTSLENINMIDVNILETIISNNLTKKQNETFRNILRQISGFYKPIHVLVVLSYLNLPVQKEFSILKNIRDLLKGGTK